MSRADAAVDQVHGDEAPVGEGVAVNDDGEEGGAADGVAHGESKYGSGAEAAVGGEEVEEGVGDGGEDEGESTRGEPHTSVRVIIFVDGRFVDETVLAQAPDLRS